MTCYNTLMHMQITFYVHDTGEIRMEEINNVKRITNKDDYMVVHAEKCENIMVFFDTPIACVIGAVTIPQSEFDAANTKPKEDVDVGDEDDSETINVKVKVSDLPPRDSSGRFMKVN